MTLDCYCRHCRRLLRRASATYLTLDFKDDPTSGARRYPFCNRECALAGATFLMTSETYDERQALKQSVTA